MRGSCTKASRVATRLSLFSRKTVMTCRGEGGKRGEERGERGLGMEGEYKNKWRKR